MSTVPAMKRIKSRLGLDRIKSPLARSHDHDHKTAAAGGAAAPPRGLPLLRNAKHNKGSAFSHEERAKFGLVGLLPQAQEALDRQVLRELNQIRKKSEPIEKYEYMMNLLDRNVSLFYTLLCNHVEELMPIVYTPTVGQACIEYGYRWTTSRGLYVSIKDKGNVRQLVNNWPENDVRVIVFTDGERILGLGDLGINGMGIPVGKLQLYAACAGIDHHQCLPVCIDVGTNNKGLLKDDFYMGLKQERVRGKEFEELIEEFMAAAVARFGRTVLIQFEDFGNSTAFHLLEKSRDRYTTFNDDIQGTASVTLAGVLASLPETAKVEGGAKKLADHTFVFLGAGEAGTGIANLIAHAIQEESGGKITTEEARKRIWLVDSSGLVTSKRTKLAHHKLDFAHDLSADKLEHLKGTEWEISEGEPVTSLEHAVRVLKPSAIIGVSAVPKTFTKDICEFLAETHAKPLIFALSNPTSKAECTAAEAYEWTDGKCIFASGSPFGTVEVELSDGERHTFRPGQGNNAYIFPGLGLGVLAAKAKVVPDELLYVAAQALAEMVTSDDRDSGSMYPPLNTIRDVSAHIAAKVAARAYKLKIATHLPQPEDLESYVRNQMVDPGYPGEPPMHSLSSPPAL